MDERDMCYFLLIFGVFSATSTTALALPQAKEHKLIQNLDTIHSNLEQLSRSVRSAHADVRTHQETLCQLFPAMSNSICSMLDLDEEMSKETQDKKILNGRFSPGKRNVRNTPNVGYREEILEDLLRKQEFLEELHNLIDNAKSTVQTERKRSCNVNLGFHCQTEQYSAIADMYNWLQSELSPGKRKRDTSDVVPETS